MAEGPGEEGSGIDERAFFNIAVVVIIEDGGAHNNGKVVIAVFAGHGDEAVAGFIGRAGFNAFGVFVIVREVAAVEHGVGVGVGSAVVFVFGGGGNFNKGFVLEGVKGHGGNILRGGVVVRVVEAGGVYEVGAGAAQGSGVIVHHINKSFAGAADVRGKHFAGVAGAVDHREVEEIEDANFVANFNAGNLGAGAD